MISAVMPPSAPQIGLAADGEVPVLTKMRSGELREGLWYSGASPTGVHSIRMPSALLWDAQGGWELTYSRMLLRHGPRDEVWTIQLPFASTIPNETEGTFFDPSARGQAVQELPSAIIPNYNSAGAPAGTDNVAVSRAARKMADVAQNLLKDENLILQVNFVWTSTLITDPTVIAAAAVIQYEREYTDYKDDLEAAYAASTTDDDSFDLILIDNIPLGTTIDYARDSNAMDSTDTVLMSVAEVYNQSGVLPPMDQMPIMYLNANASAPFDPDPVDGGIDAGSIDLTGTLVHEFLHHLGFNSAADSFPSDPTLDAISPLDIFRFNDSAGTISTFENRTLTRELRSTENTNSAFQINSSVWLKAMSTGAANQASHWKADEITGEYIGIMDPTTAPGQNNLVNNAYMQIADIRAFDAIGYDIDNNDFILNFNPMIIFPIANAEVAPDTPLTLDWSLGNGATSTDVLVYDHGTTITSSQSRGPTPVLVYRANDVSGSEMTLTSNELQLLAGHQYSWKVGVWNTLGVGITPEETFVVDCPPDVNDDGNLDFFDTSMVTSGMFDYNGDTVFDFFDISAFLDDFSAGCP